MYWPLTGRLNFYVVEGDQGKLAVRFFGVHWNFRVIYSQIQCTGAGDSPVRPAGDQEISWVVGPGIPPSKPRTIQIPDVDIYVDDDTDCDPAEAWPLVCPQYGS